ncbi:MAG: TasA family protein [Bacillota bacterium]
MKKNVVVSMLIIALAAALLGGATFAWFTDSKQVSATFTTGTIILGEDIATPLSISNMAPNDTTEWEITIANEGTLDLYYRLGFSGNGNLAKVLHVTIDGEDNVIIDGEDTLQEIIDSLAIFSTSTMRINAGAENHTLTITFHLPAETGNDYQNSTFEGCLTVEATQAKNQQAGYINWGNN